MADMTEEDKQILQQYLLSKMGGAGQDPTGTFSMAPSASTTIRTAELPAAQPVPGNGADFLQGAAEKAAAPVLAEAPAAPVAPGTEPPESETLPANTETNPAFDGTPVAPSGTKAPLSTPMEISPSTDGKDLLKGFTAEDRKALYDKLKAGSVSDIAGQSIAGVGDSVLNAYGGKDNANAMGEMQKREDSLRKEGMENFDKSREATIGDYLVGRQIVENARSDKAYNITQEQLQAAKDPNSAVSIGARRAAELLDPDGAAAGKYKGASAFDLNPALGALEKAGGVEATRNHYKMMQDQHQDLLEQQLRAERDKALSSKSGGLGLQDGKVNQAIHLRTMLNAGYDPKTQTYNLPEMQTGELVIGLANLVSNGNISNMEQLKSVTPKTARGDMAHLISYWTGTPINKEPQAMLQNLAHAIDRQGVVSQQLRDKYYEQFRKSANPKIAPEAVDRVVKEGLGSKFTDFMNPSSAPGSAPGPAESGAPSAPAVDHNAALQWAQANPNDPRASEILRRAQTAAAGSTQ